MIENERNHTSWWSWYKAKTAYSCRSKTASPYRKQAHVAVCFGGFQGCGDYGCWNHNWRCLSSKGKGLLWRWKKVWGKYYLYLPGQACWNITRNKTMQG